MRGELDRKNELALEELDRQIDELATIPLDSALPDLKEYLTSPTTNLTMQLDQDYYDFKKLAEEAQDLSIFEKGLLLDEKVASLLGTGTFDQSYGLSDYDDPMNFTPKELADESLRLEDDNPEELPWEEKMSSYRGSFIGGGQESFGFSADFTAKLDPRTQSIIADGSIDFEKESRIFNRLNESHIEEYNDDEVDAHPTTILFDESMTRELKSLDESAYKSTIPDQVLDDNPRVIINALRTLQDRVGKLEGEKCLYKEKIEGLQRDLLTARKELLQRPRKDAVTKEDVGEEMLKSLQVARQAVADLKNDIDLVNQRHQTSRVEAAEYDRSSSLKAVQMINQSQNTSFKIPVKSSVKSPAKAPVKTAAKSPVKMRPIERPVERSVEKVVKSAEPSGAGRTRDSDNLDDKLRKLKFEIDEERERRKEIAAEFIIKEKLLEKIKSKGKDPEWKVAKEGVKENREMPFMVGGNTGKSFSVTANLQRVFSLLKANKSDMCAVCSKRHPPNYHHKVAAKSNPKSDSLTQILSSLELEWSESKKVYKTLVKEYETVSTSMANKRISEVSGATTLRAIGDDIRHMIQNIESKGDQIAILRNILAEKSYSLESRPKEQTRLPAKKQISKPNSLSLLKTSLKVQGVLDRHI